MGPDPDNGKWCKPPLGYLKLNVDESFRDGQAAYGGVLRDCHGMWIWGFVGIVSLSSSLAEELHALNMGLQLFLRKNITRVLVETNASAALNLMHGYADYHRPMHALILECKQIHHVLWSSPIAWVLCNCNMLAYMVFLN